MKKQVAGFLAGAIFTLSATAFADDIKSLVGKKVQAEYTVEVDGKVLNTVVVEGKNYAPVRAIGEAAGYSIVVDGKKVILNSEVKAVDNIKTLPSSKYTKEQLAEEIKYYENMIKGNQEALERVKESISSGKYSGDELTYLQTNLEKAEKNLTNDKSRLAELEAQLAELQGQ